MVPSLTTCGLHTNEALVANATRKQRSACQPRHASLNNGSTGEHIAPHVANHTRTGRDDDICLASETTEEVRR
eukprot:5055581-Amphidinium_carterae.2